MKSIFTILTLFLINTAALGQGVSWKECLENKNGEITIRYFDSDYFINTIQDDNQNAKIIGLEYDLMLEFVNFIKKEYAVSLTIKFEKSTSFGILYEEIKNAPTGVFGLSNYSITSERLAEVKFSPPYMPGVEVLVSSANISIASSEKELFQLLEKNTALQVPSTTFEANFKALKKKIPTLKIVDIENSVTIRNTISQNENLFAYVELPVYIEELRKGVKYQRQNFLRVNRIGYGVIYSKKSDWDKPINAFFQSAEFKPFINKTIKKYFGNTEELLWEIAADSKTSSDNEISILTEEKGIQRKQLQQQEMTHIKDEFKQNLLIAGVTFFVLIALILVWANIDRQKKNVVLQSQKNIIVQKNNALHLLNEEKDALMSIVAHDLKSPLNNIQGLLQLLPLEGTLNKEQEHSLSIVRKTVKQGQKLIDELLEVNTLEQGRFEVELEEVNLHRFLETFLIPYKNTAEAKQIIIHTECPENCTLFTDIAILERVLDNLLSNAIKFSKKEKAIYLEVNQDEKIQLSVRDEGPGISEEDQKKMFKKFQKLTARPTAGESSNGLGLAIVKLLLEQLKSEIIVNSELNKGTEFQLVFPS